MAEELGKMRNCVAYTVSLLKAKPADTRNCPTFFPDCGTLSAWEHFFRMGRYHCAVLHRDLYLYSLLSSADENHMVY